MEHTLPNYNLPAACYFGEHYTNAPHGSCCQPWHIELHMLSPFEHMQIKQSMWTDMSNPWKCDFQLKLYLGQALKFSYFQTGKMKR